jgi:hypothetical protein
MWQKALGGDHEAVFVFTYRIVRPDVDLDGQETLSLGPDRYVFFCIRVEDYCPYMRPRSRKWGTASLTTEDFRRFALGLRAFLA